MEFHVWLLFLLTCCGIALVPGPNAFLVLTHGAIHGNRKTLSTIAGGVIGLTAMVALCALGLGALIQASVSLFTVLKVIGGLYLIWLGINLWRSAPLAIDLADAPKTRNSTLFQQGLLAAASNPKALLLFTAFIPPFLDPQQNPLVQALIIALTYAAVEFVVEFFVAFAAHQVRPWLARLGRRFNKICGGFFVLFGAVLPFR